MRTAVLPRGTPSWGFSATLADDSEQQVLDTAGLNLAFGRRFVDQSIFGPNWGSACTSESMYRNRS